MKKVYVKPSMESTLLSVETLMIATSIENETGDAQIGVKEDNRDDFEAGAKDNNNSAWSTWDD